MRYTLLICLLVGCGLTDDPDMRELKNSLRITGEEVTAKQDESIVILRENTTALAAIKSQVESMAESTTSARQALEALVVKSEAPKAEEEVIKSAVEPQEVAKANPSQSSQPVASPPAVRSSAVKMSWNVEGNWSPTILETAKHLREDHGIIADGMSHQQMHDAHAAAHEGRPVAIKTQPVQLINRGSQCPNGQCPTPRRGLFGRRR
jgi:hypothetical protein